MCKQEKGVPLFSDCMYFNLMALSRILQSEWQVEFGKLGLSSSEAYLLVAIVENPEATQKEIGELMCLDLSTITRHMDGLQRKGLIEKMSRGKGATWKVLPEGKKAYKKIKASMNDLRSRMKDHFGGREFERLVKLLHQARFSFEDE